MPVLKTDEECCGCTACAAICGHDAITMTQDALGFLYPKVNYDKCIECKLCEKVCSFHENYDVDDNFKDPIPWGARLTDISEVMKSRSGGAFVAFTNWILDKGGVVYGVGYKEHFRVSHKRAESKKERDEFRGSKYVQSDMTGILRNIRADLQKGRKVLFSGTPCQTSAVRSFISKRLHGNLWLVDIVCHGTPSPNIWYDYLRYLEAKEKARIVMVNFRDKIKYGWKAHKETFVFDNNKVKNFDGFTYLFHQEIISRKSCGNCHFCNLHRPSDLTLADFWGWERTGTNINDDDKGLSLVLVNTEKGKELFNAVSNQLILVNSSLENSLQPRLERPSLLNPQWISFKEDYISNGFSYVFHKYGNVGWRYKLKSLKAYGKRLYSKILKTLKMIRG